MAALAPTLVALALAPPPAWIQRGTKLRWLRAGTRDGLFRIEIAVDVTGPGGETAYLLRVRRGFTLELVRSVRGTSISPTVFSK
jgi:hypothetical protein